MWLGAWRELNAPEQLRPWPMLTNTSGCQESSPQPHVVPFYERHPRDRFASRAKASDRITRWRFWKHLELIS